MGPMKMSAGLRLKAVFFRHFFGLDDEEKQIVGLGFASPV